MTGYQWARVEECIDGQDRLSDWERDFIQSLHERGEQYQLSERQNHKLNAVAQSLNFSDSDRR